MNVLSMKMGMAHFLAYADEGSVTHEQALQTIIWFSASFLIVSVVYLGFCLVSLPLRRRQTAALVFQIIENGLGRGRSPEAALRDVTERVGRSAMQSGAVRSVRAVDAMHTGAGKKYVLLQLDFKDGVSAQHVTPVLDKLRRAVIAEDPSVTDVVLAPRTTDGAASGE